jgi:hypothetical protein
MFHFIKLNAATLSVIMLSIKTLRQNYIVFILFCYHTLFVDLMNVILPSALLLNIILMNLILLNVILLNGILLSVTLLIVVLLRIILMSVIQLSAEYHGAI